MSQLPPAYAGGAGGRLGWAVVPLALAQLIVSLDIYIVFVAMPEMGDKLGFTAQNLQWVVSAYAVAFGGFLLLGGRAADLFGKRRMFLLALGLYAGSSLVGGFANDPAMIIIVRAVQGLGGALLFPTTLSLVNTMFEEGRSRNRALAVWGGAGASGLTLGSLLGGVLTGAFGWASVFFVNVPLAVGIAIAALVLIPADRPRTGPARKFDLPGTLTVTAGITLIVFVLVQGPDSGWLSTPIVLSAAIGVLLLAAFFLIESRTGDPLMPLRLFRNRSLVTAMAITFTFMATFGTVPYFLTVFFQDVSGYSAMTTGVAFLTQAVAIAVGTQVGERMATRSTTRSTVITGFAVGGVGIAVLALGVLADGNYWYLVPGLVVMGVGQGIAWTGMWIAAASGVSDDEQGIASGMASTTQQVGYAIGLAVLVAIANADTRGLAGEALRFAVSDGIQTSFYIAGVLAVLGAVVAMTLPRPKPEVRTTESDQATDVRPDVVPDVVAPRA
ncbi:MFS transporter [Actinokineospora sp. NBRC 105648]|uniref:MFS transporter n=1 Tax=Actinokineospora sp. NBRC 105648 TaxID=3032206 RepID=UPI0024A4E416|nr:MFS transporter [Actinokineospora sp. NBRC 105648]GLZ36587.1 MFS transporter [Actinokineospora sp. NBRC 105648]